MQAPVFVAAEKRFLDGNSNAAERLLTEYLDQIPQANLCVEIQGYRFEIMEIEDNSIAQVKIFKPKKNEA